MSAFGRLWRRAPIWRRCVYATGVAIGMLIAFPPGWMGGVRPLRSVAEQRVVEPAAPGVTEIRPDPSVVPRANDLNIPVAGTLYSGRLPMGGQSVPLPPGRWAALAVTEPGVASAAGPPAINVFLALILGGRVSAAAVIGGSVAPDTAAGGFAAPLEAQIPAYYYRRVVASADHGPLDLWVCGIAVPARWNDPLRQAAAGVIKQQGIVLSERLDSAVFRFADRRNWVSADFMFPDPSSSNDPVRGWVEAAALSDTAPLSHLEKVRRWGKAWHDIMRRGFDGTLRAGEEARIAPP